MKPYSMDFRERVAAARDQGMEVAEVVETFGCCEAWVRRLLQRRRERGTLTPTRRKAPDQRAVKDEDRRRLHALLKERPDATLAELIERLELKVHPGTLSRTLDDMGLPRKKRRSMPRSKTGRTSRRRATAGSGSSWA